MPSRSPGRPHPAVAAARSAVREVLKALDGSSAAGGLVLVACSGGSDSLALAAAAAFEGPRAGLRVGLVTVDHRLQPGSGDVADRVLDQGADLGLDPRLRVDIDVPPAGAGPEADARAGRYAALDAVAGREGAVAVLLGHTRDDQAEQVLLGLTRGSGTRSLGGMPAVRGVYRRPFLALSRADLRAACRAQDLTWWEDPMNADEAYARVRARRLLHDWEDALGPGIAAGLARSADLLRADADHLDALTEVELIALGPGPWPVHEVAELPRAVRGRVWRRLLVAAGAPAGQLSSRHTEACDRLLTHWRGQGPITVPGPVSVSRRDGRVIIEPAPPVE